jgi:prepilin-type processing-associated H-X9-DG protein
MAGNTVGQPGTANNAYILNFGKPNTPLGASCASSYSYNGWFYSAKSGVDGYGVEQTLGVTDPAWVYSKDSAITSPTLTPVYADGIWEDACPTEIDSPCVNLWSGANWNSGSKKGGFEMGRIAIQRHGGVTAAARNITAKWGTSPPRGGVNVTTFDGHAELCKLPDLWSYKWHQAWGQKYPPAIGTPATYQ